MNLKIEIGTQFIMKSKSKDLHTHTVIDIYKTYNNAGELVQTRYVTEHEFMGQKVVNRDVLGTTIKKSLYEIEKLSGE